MRTLIMWNIVTIDGYFEGESRWELPWLEQIWGEELEQFSLEQLRSAEMLVFGRVTYEGMASYWRAARGEIAEYMNGLPKIVCSRTLETADWSGTTIVRRDAAGEIAALKAQGTGTMFLFGSADLSATLMKAGLFDEYRLAIAPTVVGSGRRLFGRGAAPQQLALVETRPLATGGVYPAVSAGGGVTRATDGAPLMARHAGGTTPSAQVQ